jgi:predicted peptidase
MPQQSESFTMQSQITYDLNYWLYLPPDYQNSEPLPVILFLHGGGERGNNLEKVKAHGLPKIVETQDMPFIIISPQCPKFTWWSAYLPALNQIIDNTVLNYNGDARRIYCTGLSMGGYGTWHFALEYPDKFAAIAPICGGWLWAFEFFERLCTLKHLPIWAFHGEQDKVVPPLDSREMVDKLNGCGGNARLTMYPGVGHDSWTITYDNPELYIWFLSHTCPE